MHVSRWGALVVLLAAAIVAGVAFGTLHLSPGDVMHGLIGDGAPMSVAVVRTLRLPRVLLAALVGAGLAAAGAALQGSTRNKLAEPYLLGVSGGAAVGAVLATAARAPASLIPIAAFAGALTSVALALLVARASGGRGDPRVVLMAGVVVGAFANAVIMVVLANADAGAIRGALWWMMGSVTDASWMQVRVLFVFVVVGVGVLVALGRAIDVLALGDDTAAGLGIHVGRVSLGVYCAGALLAAGTVSAAGLVGFVGLLVPHLVRLAGARTHRTIIAAAALGGASLVVFADLFARTARAPSELPLGAVTALIGVPFFLILLRRLT
ncbi:MAG: ABC-type transporter, integral rane subunit [Gemmatimonadetes bacterium]|nr:ABC-type transporter, integral rane subunit [Gemmatimonadota bacterium]